MKRPARPALWIGAAVVLLALAAAWWWHGRAPAPEWRLAPVTRGPVEVSVTATGAVEAVTTVLVGTQVSGVVASMHADFNSHVKKGEVIARIDTTLLHAALVDARSGLERATAQERQTAAERDRARGLFARDLISRSEVEAAEAEARVAAANLSSARAGLDRARINLRYAIIQSPIDGIVLDRAVDPGQTVAASLNAPTLFTIAGDLRQMRVRAAVDEADIGKVREGQAATFTVDAYPDTVFSGSVEQVRLQPKVTQNVVTYDVILRAENPDLKLMPGMTANLTIVTERRDDVLRAPAAALRFVPPIADDANERPKRDTAKPSGMRGAGAGSEHRREHAAGARRGRVYVLDNGKPKAVRVQVGISDGSQVEIEGPLQPGAQVIVGLVGATSAANPAAGSPFGMKPRGMGGQGGGRR
jgi:HlyD family secretion protein